MRAFAEIQFNARWLTADTIDSVDWLPADQGILEQIKRKIRNDEDGEKE